MTRARRWFRTIGLVSLGAVAVAAVAHRAPTIASAEESGRPFAGQLNRPLEAVSAADLTALVARLDFTGGSERARLCSGTPECDAGRGRTSARIEAVDQAPIGATNIPVNGVIVTRFENTGSFTERRYGLAPGGVAYVIATPTMDTAAVGRWTMVQISGKETKVIANGQITSCGHGAYPGKPQADFRTCTSAAVAHGKGMTINSASFRAGDDDPIWAACAGGCCVATQTRPPVRPPSGIVETDSLAGR